MGYTGGDTEAPTYGSVCSGDGHTEAIKIEYDPDVISYDSLLSMFWEEHNPSGYKPKVQYKSAIWPTTEAQEEGQEEAEGEEADNGETPAVPSARQTRRRAVSPASRTPASPRLQPPPGWKVASSKGTKLVVPPETMVGLEAQATVTSAWRVHREYVKLHGEHDTAPVPRASTRGGTSAAASSH